MVSPRVFILILTTLLCSELAGAHPEKALSTALVSIGGIALGFGLLAKTLALSELKSVSGRDFETAYERFVHKRRLVEVLWCVTLPATLVLTGWAAGLNHWESLGVPSLFIKLGLFLPTGIFLLLLELTTAQFEELVGENRWDDEAGNKVSWQSHFLTRVRLGDFSSFLTCIGPVVAIAFFADLSAVSGVEGLSASTITILAVCGALGFLCLYPWLVTLWVGAARLQESNDVCGLFERVTRYTVQLKIRGTKTHIVSSDGRWAGAAIVGWFPGCRRLWLGDALLEHLTAREVDMVIMHEFAHVLRKHFLWRIFPAIWAIGVGAAVWMLVQAVGGAYEASIIAQVIGGILSCTTLFFGLGVMARATELDADRHACALAVEACAWAASPAEAACELNSALSKLLGEKEQTARASWMHPSLTARQQQLKAIQNSSLVVA